MQLVDRGEELAEEFKRLTAGRQCDCTALSYERLRGGSVQWPGGCERLYDTLGPRRARGERGPLAPDVRSPI